MNFVAIDFETANYNRESICAMGIAIVENGRITKTISHLIKPTPNYFIPMFTDIHGITKQMVSKKPNFAELWEEIEPVLKNKTLVAHNASFDMGVLKSTLEYYGLNCLSSQYYCSLAISRKTNLNLENHQLSTVCRYLGVPLKHHDAESDAVGAAEIVIKACEAKKAKSLQRLARILQINLTMNANY